MITKIIICLIVPLLFFSLINKKENRLVALFLCIGTFACYLACLSNTAILKGSSCTYFYLTTTIAPIIEETLKFIPIMFLVFFGKCNKDKVFAAAFALGIGFAITENIYMLVENADNIYIQWVILRSISTGLAHSMSASIIAFGIMKAKEYPKLCFVGIIASLFLAMIYHGFYNCLTNDDSPTAMRCIGVIIPILTYTIIFVLYKKEFIIKK